MSNGFIDFPNLLEMQRKRRALLDPTENYNYDMTVPNQLQIDPNATPLGSNVPQGGHPKLDILSKILSAVSTGIGVGASNDPGKALLDSLMATRQEAMQKYQIKQKQDEIKQQQTFEKSQQESAQQQQKDLQKSEQVFKASEGESQDQFTLKRDSIKFQNDKAAQQSDQEARLKIVQLNQDFSANEATKSQEFQKQMEEAKSSNDIKQVMIKSTMGALLSANKYKHAAPISQVMNIVGKMQNDEALTPEDTAVIDRAIHLNSLGTGQTGSAKLTQKFQQKSYLDLQNDENDIIKGIILKDKTPIINPSTGQPMMDAMGKPIMQNGSPEEIAQKVRDGVALFRSVTGYQKTQTQHIQQNSQPTTNSTQVVDGLIQQGQSPQTIINMINSSNMSDDDKKKAKTRAQQHIKTSPIAQPKPLISLPWNQ